MASIITSTLNPPTSSYFYSLTKMLLASSTTMHMALKSSKSNWPLHTRSLTLACTNNSISHVMPVYAASKDLIPVSGKSASLKLSMV